MIREGDKIERGVIEERKRERGDKELSMIDSLLSLSNGHSSPSPFLTH